MDVLIRYPFRGGLLLPALLILDLQSDQQHSQNPREEIRSVEPCKIYIYIIYIYIYINVCTLWRTKLFIFVSYFFDELVF